VNLRYLRDFNDTNVNKRSLSLNVQSQRALDIVKRLIAISDIVIEILARACCRNGAWCCEELCKVKPDIVYVSMSGYGHTGRNHHYTTFGPVAQAVSGLTFISGLPDKPPARVGLVVYGRYWRDVWCDVCPHRSLSSPHDEAAQHSQTRRRWCRASPSTVRLCWTLP
jgi:hypothetical protein